MANSLGITEVTLTQIIAAATLAVAAQGTLTIDTQPLADDTMTIGTKVFTFVTDETASADGEIDVGADLADAKVQIVAAINGTDHNGVHPLVTCIDFATNDCVITARLTGTAGNAIVTTETFDAGTNVFDDTTLGTTTLGVTPTDANSVNGIDPAGRVSAFEPMVVRVMGHDADTGAEEDNPDLMALFVSKSQGHPWVKDRGVLERITFEAADGTTPATSDSTYIVPFLDYSLYE